MSDYPFLPDSLAVRRCYDRVAKQYASVSVVPRDIYTRLEARLDYLAIAPKVVLDLGCGNGFSLPGLRKRYKKASLIGLDLSLTMLSAYRSNALFSRKPWLLQADASKLPLADGSVDLVVSSLMLPLCAEPALVFSEINRVLSARGCLLFTTLGPDSMKSLFDVLAVSDPMNQQVMFPDMHDVGDMMVRAGLAQPVLDIEYLTVRYESVAAMLSELRACGGINVAKDRRRGLSTQRRRDSVQRALELQGVSALSLELVQGHAWKGLPSSEAVKFGGNPGSVIPIHPVS